MKLKTILPAILFLSALTVPVQAQVGEQRYNFTVGINGGVNLNSVSFSPSVQQKNIMAPVGGITLRYVSERFFRMICGVQLEVNYSQHGWDEFYEDYPDLQYTRKMNYVELPFLAHLAFGKEGHGLQFFLNAGPQIGFFLNESYTQSGPWENYPNLTTEQHDMDVENKFDYGITAGLGVELRTKVGHFQVEGRYYYGLSDFYHSTKERLFRPCCPRGDRNQNGLSVRHYQIIRKRRTIPLFNEPKNHRRECRAGRSLPDRDHCS